MMNRKTITPKLFTATVLATVSFTILLVFLASTVRTGNKINMAYVSDAPGSSALAGDNALVIAWRRCIHFLFDNSESGSA